MLSKLEGINYFVHHVVFFFIGACKIRLSVTFYQWTENAGRIAGGIAVSNCNEK